MFGPERTSSREIPHRYAVGDEVRDKQGNKYVVEELAWYEFRWHPRNARYTVRAENNDTQWIADYALW